jgi:predicted porin
MALNGSYNLGMAKVAVGYVDTDSAAGKGMFAMVTGSMGSLAPFVGFATNTETDTNAWDAGAFYSLSKRTRVYGIIGSGNNAVADRWSIGMDHNF